MATGEILHELIEKTAPGDRARHLKVFAERLFLRLPTDLAARTPPGVLLELAQSAFDFFSVRTATIQLRITDHAADGSDGRALGVIESVMPDCPFIVDSVREYFHQLAVPPRLLLHPVLRVSRDAERRLASLESASANEGAESFLHIEADLGPEPRRAEIAAELERRLTSVLQVATDSEPMTQRALAICDELAPARELVEVRDFLRWLVRDGLIFLGYRRYTLSEADGRRLVAVAPGSGLGILRAEERSRFATARPLDSIALPAPELVLSGPHLIVGKTRSYSDVHRCRPMEDIVLRRADSQGRTIGFDRFLGLFSAKAAAEEARHVPILRTKLKEVLEAEHAVPGSHDYKELVALFNSFPREELFRASPVELGEQLDFILDPKNEGRVRVNAHRDRERGIVVLVVVMPRERFSSEVQAQLEEALARRLQGTPVYHHLAMDAEYSARLHFCFWAPSPAPVTLPELEREVVRIAQRWEDRLRRQLSERMGEERGHALSLRYGEAFSVQYKSATEVERAVADIERLEAMLAAAPPCASVALYPAPRGGADNTSDLRIYELGQPLVLSELMPLLQNFAIRVLSEQVHELSLECEGRPVRAFIEAFVVQGPAQQALGRMPGAELLAEALAAVLNGQAQDDQLNALVLSAALSWREAALMRALLAAAFQMRLAPARPALRRVFLLFPELARRLVDLFVARLDPAVAAPPERLEQLWSAYLERLSAVDNIADDRTARSVLAMVEAAVRTNYFRPPPTPDPYIALKFESGRIPDLPDVAPLFEIHVDSPRMAGCHLRAGKIARGGIRFSDRLDDYRSEILSLMKTQTVKNAIIVPVGSKGGFVIKPGRAPGAGPADAVAAYTTLIRAMLELTDNLVDGELVHPERVKVLDNDGPYLVVAADKGTAAFSDLANRLAAERGFWLGDAFASGGEHGYDHKRLGITARGAWESVKRHLHEMGRDPERGAPVTMVGIGDMSGDVFGNALLQSNNLRLLAAFDHRHIFLDPNPDPAASFAERKRLYQLPNSQWSDYNPALISAGGGVYRRGQKRIVLSPESRAVLGLAVAELDGDSLIGAIMRADVDLLYNGGIGTYVRASDETDAQVGDHTYDSCRITAAELRARMVVEGGNLGFTQRARIEYALAGGRINTDAIDNSAGVDLSDHEVNLKILLAPALKRGALRLEHRNCALVDAAPELVELVLEDNRDQVLLLSLEQLRSRGQTSAFRDHLTAIESRGLLRRHEEALPTHEQLRERHRRFPGLTRPELAVLSAYTKLDLLQQLESAELIDEPYLVERFLRPYFPASITRRFAAEVPGHQLRRALIATELVNELVDSMGSIFIFGLTRDCCTDTERAVRAWLVASDVLESRPRSARLRAAGAELTVQAETAALLELDRAVNRATSWALGNIEAATLDIAQVVAHFKPPLARQLGEFEAHLAGPERERFEAVYRGLRTAGHREETALELARLALAHHLLNIISLSFELGVALEPTAAVYFGLGELIDFALLEGAIEAVGSDDRWEQRAAHQLDDELLATRVKLTRAALGEGGGGDSQAVLERMRQSRARRLSEVQALLAEIRTLRHISLPAIQVALRMVGHLPHDEAVAVRRTLGD